MRTKLIANDFGRLWNEISPQALAALERVGQSGQWILGHEVRRLEQSLPTYLGLTQEYGVVGVANGMDAIEIGLRALSLRPGDRVLTTPLSAFATTLAIIRSGGIPIFCDVTPDGLLDLNLAEELLKTDPSIRFLIPVHLYGRCINLEHLKLLKERYGVWVVEDCAQAAGASYADVPAGSQGDVAATSFYPTKNIGAMGDAGALITRNPSIERIARQLRDYGQEEKYVHSRLGLNSRLDELHAAILSDAILPKLFDFLCRRRDVAAFYMQELSGLKSALSFIEPAPTNQNAWHLFPIQIKGEESTRDQLLRSLTQLDINLSIHYPRLIPEQSACPAFVSAQEAKSRWPCAYHLSRTQVSLPIHPHLKLEELKRVVDALKQWSKIG